MIISSAMVRSILKRFRNSDERRIGLALGGGAILGAAHIGILKAFEERQVHISGITGTSVGAFVGALYAFGLSTDEIEEIALNLKWLDVAAVRLSKLGFISLSRVQNFLEEHLGYVEFKDAKIPLAVVATDIGTAEKIIYSSGPLAPAVIASMSMPGIFQPVEYDGRMLVDGGLLETVPVSPLGDMNVNERVAVNLIAKRHYRNPQNIIELIGNTIDITINNVTAMQTVNADLIIAPELSAYNPADPRQVPDLIEEGYEEAVKVLDSYFSADMQGP